MIDLSSTIDDFSDARFNVINSILNSRIEQVEAITLPNDLHRKDLIHAIQKIESYPKRLSSFLDYLIDYTYHINLELNQKQDQLNDVIEELSSLKNPQKVDLTEKKASAKLRNISNILGVDETNLEESIKVLKKNFRRPNINSNEDYIKSLKLLNAEEGNLHQTLHFVVEENRKLHKINNDLTVKKQKSSNVNYNKNYLFEEDYSLDYDKKVDISDLKDQFDQIETDLVTLRQQVQNKFSVIHPNQ